MAAPELETSRLRLRSWRDADRAPFAALNADPEVMRYLPALLDRVASDAWIERIEAGFEARGYGLWAVERRGPDDFIGFVGLSVPSFEAEFTPCVEIGWRLARDAWGSGYASEAARAVLDFGFEHAGLARVVSFTARGNVRSRRVMERIGMRIEASFEHPTLPPEHPLRTHVLYAIARSSSR